LTEANGLRPAERLRSEMLELVCLRLTHE